MSADPLRILHVIASVGPAHGGPSVMVAEMAQGLADAGHAVTVVTTDEDAGRRLDVALGEPILHNGVTYIHFRRQLRPATISLPLARWLNERVFGFDVVHIHGMFSHPTAAAARAARRAGVPYVVRPLGALHAWGLGQGLRDVKRLWLRWVDLPLLAGAAAIHYTSSQEEEDGRRAGAPDAGTVLPLGLALPHAATAVDRTWLAVRHPDLVDRPVVLFLSRLHPKKGLDLLLPAFAAARRRHGRAALLVVGDGAPAYVTQLTDRLGPLGLTDHVRFTGHLEGAAKAGALAAADLFVLPSRSENFGVVVVEALAAALPVIATEGVPLAAAVAEAGAGWCVPATTADLEAALTSALALPPEERRSMGVRGRALAQARWTRSAMVARLEALYRSVAA